jgi:hypothetical protein
LPDQPARTAVRALLTAFLTTALAAIAAGGTAHASPALNGAPPVGPAVISPLGHPGLCWQGEGDGSAVSLAPCDATIQGQLWSFNGNRVVMNGNGYCLQNPGATGPGRRGPLFLSFSGQCAGAARQAWTFSGSTNTIMNPSAGACAYPRDGSDVPGAAIVARPCGRVRSVERWSFGISRLTLSDGRRVARGRGADGAPAAQGARGTAAGSRAAGASRTAGVGRGAAGGGAAGGGAADGGAADGTRRVFSAQVTVANAAGAMTAYGAVVTLRPPKGLVVTRLAGSGGLSGWTCTVRDLTCQGTLAGGLTGLVTASGNFTGQPSARSISVRAAVTRTNEPRRGIRPVLVPVRVFTVAAAGSVPGGSPVGAPAGSGVRLVLIIGGLLVALGIILAMVSRRRPRAAAAAAAPAPHYPAGPAPRRYTEPAAPDPAPPSVPGGTPHGGADPAAPSSPGVAGERAPAAGAATAAAAAAGNGPAARDAPD